MKLLCVLCTLLVASTARLCMADVDPYEEKLLNKLDALESEVQTLKRELRDHEQNKGRSLPAETQPAVPASESTKSDITSTRTLNKDLDPSFFARDESHASSGDSLRFGSYGEFKYGRQQTDGGWKDGFDAGRVVLLGTYPIKDNILFNTEIEFEHGGIALDEDDKLGGAVEIEQAYVDFKVNDYFNWRSPGVDVVPVGYIGLFHEPTQFYSVDRPELYNGLIPSTWFAGASSVYGKVADNLTYQFQISTGLEDAGTLASESDGSIEPGGYDPGISGTDGLGLARASISDRKQLSNNLGYALRFAYTPPVVPGLAGSTSIYYTPNTSVRGAYGTNNDETERLLGKSDLTMFDTELRYRVPETGLELRGEFVDVLFGRSENLRANNDADPTNNVGDTMYGYSFEGAYHFPAKSGWDFVPFYRYTYQDFQTSGFSGTDLNEPTGAGRQTFHTFGISIFPTPKLVIKFDYQRALDDAADSPKSDHLLGSIGYFF